MTAAVHISLKVRDLDVSVDFYRRLLGEPAKRKGDYAKFVTAQPPLHLALEPGLETTPAGALSHLGIRLGTTEEVQQRRAELQARGLVVEDENRSACCYALQDKIWVSDPDGNRWEIYTVLEDLETMAPEAEASCCAEAEVSCCPPQESRSGESCCVA